MGARLGGAHLLAGAIGLLAIGALAPPSLRQFVAEDGPGCIFRAVTGIVCPFCGMTHGLIALGHGDLAAAHADNPLVIPILVLHLWVGVTVLLGHPLAVGRRRTVGARALLAMVAIMWVTNIAAHHLI
ncbi:MAG TPA: DUF2752 domain-containing protein [Kofleriaceae bacterium]|nr:DUF2752 domain-containing protein [Kofleriaceae bacterium]